MCERRLNLCQKSENIPTEWIPKSSIFDRSSIYQSWTFDPKKCVFDRSRVAQRRYVFAKLTGPLISTDRGCLDYASDKPAENLSVAVVVGAGRVTDTQI